MKWRDDLIRFLYLFVKSSKKKKKKKKEVISSIEINSLTLYHSALFGEFCGI